MVMAIVATFCAVVLVFYFQHRALATLRAQTGVILTQLSEQTATDVAVEVRRTLDGPVFDTLTAVNHPVLRLGNLDLVAEQFEEGLNLYPQVERFFVWTKETELAASGQALFYGRDGAARRIAAGGAKGAQFEPDPALGRPIVELGRRYVGDQHIYFAAESVGPDGHHVFLRLFFNDARRVDYFALLGFVTKPQLLRQRFFATLHERGLAALLQRRGGEVPLQLRVIDETGTLVYGSPLSHPARPPLSSLCSSIRWTASTRALRRRCHPRCGASR
jgi:hypothetical protein